MRFVPGIVIASLVLAVCSVLLAILVLWMTYGCWWFEWDDNPPQRIYSHEGNITGQ